MGIKKTDLYNHLWEAANALRGGLDASQYKDYVLTILFVKYVTDRYKNDPFTEEDVNELVVKKKWLKRLKDRVKDEIDDIILNLVMRIKELAERYETPLPEIEKKVGDYEKKVKEHLKIMGLEV